MKYTNTLRAITLLIMVVAVQSVYAGPTFRIKSLSNFYSYVSHYHESTSILWTVNPVDCDGTLVDEVRVELGEDILPIFSTGVGSKSIAFLNYTMLMNAAEKALLLEVIDPSTYWSYDAGNNQCVLVFGGNQGLNPPTLPLRVIYQ